MTQAKTETEFSVFRYTELWTEYQWWHKELQLQHKNHSCQDIIKLKGFRTVVSCSGGLLRDETCDFIRLLSTKFRTGSFCVWNEHEKKKLWFIRGYTDQLIGKSEHKCYEVALNLLPTEKTIWKVSNRLNRTVVIRGKRLLTKNVWVYVTMHKDAYSPKMYCFTRTNIEAIIFKLV